MQAPRNPMLHDPGEKRPRRAPTAAPPGDPSLDARRGASPGRRARPEGGTRLTRSTRAAARC